MEIVALVLSILWAMLLSFFALVAVASGGGVHNWLEKLYVVVLLVLGYGPFAYVLYSIIGS